MKMTNVAVRRGVTFFMIYLIAVGFGLFSLARLKLDLYPKLEFPYMAVITQYTGVGPADIETVITRPVEEAVSTVQNVKKVTSTSTQGLSMIMLEFDWDTDLNQAENDIRNNIDFIQDMLPDDATDPLVFKFDPSQQPIMYLTINSDIHGLAELRHISEHELEPRLERLPGVASAATTGGLIREIRILVEPERLRAHHLSIAQVSQALQMNNLQIPSGFIENEQQEFTIKTTGDYSTIEEIANTAISSFNGNVIKIKDIAKVEDGFKEQRQVVWADGKPAVACWVQKQSDANTVQTANHVVSNLEKITSELPKGVEIGIYWNQADFINRSMSNLGNTAVQAVVLAFFVLLFFLRNMKSSLIVAVSIPVSIVLTFAVMDQAGITLNIISMAGLALAVGLLVDNSIVVLENIFRMSEEGKDAVEASTEGASEVSMAITASTLTTLSVFVPILFVPGISGKMFNEMGLTICFSLSVSLLVALTLVPLLSSRMLKAKTVSKGGYWSRVGERIKNRMNKIYDSYANALEWSLGHRKTVLWSTLGLFVIAMFLLFGRGGEFMPQNDQGYIETRVERAPGTSLEQMQKTVAEMVGIVQESVPEAELVYSAFGQGEGLMAMFSSQSSAEGEVSMRLSKVTERDRDMFEIQDELREKFDKIPGVTVKFSDGGMGALFGAGDIVVQVIGHDLQVAQTLADSIKKMVDEVEGVVFTETTMEAERPELEIKLDRDRIANLGLSTAQVGTVVSTSVLGTVVTRFREGGDEYDVRVQLAKDSRKSKTDLGNILVMTQTGQHVPLRAISDIDYIKTPQQIQREDQERYVSVNIDISGRDLQSVTKDVKAIVKDLSIPNDFRIEIGGQAEDQQESFMYLMLAMLVAVLLTYMVMASQFESFVDPFIILFTIPLSLIGVGFALLVTNTTLSVMVFIGIIMLVGIVVNNGIVLVDYINQLREKGMELLDAIKQAGRVRIRPVLMTAMTTILAMLPLALGLGESGESWAPMARSVMGGLMVATVLTLLIVPTIYAALEIGNAKRKAKRKAKKEAKLAKA